MCNISEILYLEKPRSVFKKENFQKTKIFKFLKNYISLIVCALV